MVFMRCNADHHGVALVGGMESESKGAEMHNIVSVDHFLIDLGDGNLMAITHRDRNAKSMA